MKRRGFFELLTAILALSRQSNARETNQQQSANTGNPSGFVIAGVVVNAGTNAPIGQALVQISLTTDRTKNSSVVTGPDGRFSFTNLPANKFALTVTRQSGMSKAYLASGNFSSAIVTGPDQKTANIIFRFHMPGVLAGTITDEWNEPVRNATVHAFVHQIDQTGIRRVVMSGATSTKASGHFRFANVIPGSYILGVNARPWFAQSGPGQFAPGQADASDTISFRNGRPNGRTVARSDPQFDVVYPFTYYPNAAEPASASLIAVTEGNETAIQLSLRTVPSIHIRLAGGDTRPGAGTNVQVSVLGPENLPIPLNVGGFAQSGQGELSGLAPGRYQLAMNTFHNRSQDFSGDAVDTMATRGGFARRIVDLVDGSTVDLGALAHTSIQATVKTATGEKPGNRIALMLRDRRTGNSINAVAAADDTIHFPEANLSAGRYEISLPNTPLFRILSFDAKGAKVLSGELLIGENANVELSVLIGRKSSINVDGFVTKDDAPLVGAMVLLLPKVTSLLATPYRDQTDSDGSFTLHNVSAGTYFAIAIENGHDLAFGEPAVLQPYLQVALTVTINESNAPPTLKLKAQPLASS